MPVKTKKSQRVPDASGYFGPFGGQFVPETVMGALEELCTVYAKLRKDPEFKKEFRELLEGYAGRPTMLYPAKRLSKALGIHQIYLKREDLLHTGAHKINNALGQVLLAKRMGKKRIIAETGAGQHGVATATACALMGIDCEVFMGVEDMERQRLNVVRMQLMGAKVVPVTSGTQTLKDACSEAIRDWVTHVEHTHYCIGSVVGPHPYPMMVRDFQAVIGQEARKQIIKETGRLPHALVACVGGGSNAMGLFYPFQEDKAVELYGVEAGGVGMSLGKHSATLVKGRPGVLHGAYSTLLQDEQGQVAVTESVSAGLDYPGVGPEHAYYQWTQRAQYVSVSDKQALKGCQLLCETEGILPALESSHAIAFLPKLAEKLPKKAIVILNLSGRGDKDVTTLANELYPDASK